MAACSARISVFLLLPLLASCSLNYAQDQAEAPSFPEVTLMAASFFRYEDNAMSFSLDSPRIEQYASPAVTFVEDAQFASYSREGELEVTGSCALLGISQAGGRDAGELTFYGAVRLEQIGDGMMVEGEALRWNTGSGSVASPAQGLTTLTRGALTLEGRGFSAREEGAEFSFASGVSGSIISGGTEED